MDTTLEHDPSEIPHAAGQACINGDHNALLRLLDEGKVVDNKTYPDWKSKWEFDETEWSRDGRAIQSLARLAASHRKLNCYAILLLYPDSRFRSTGIDPGLTYLYAMHMMCPEVMQDLLRICPYLLHGRRFHFETYFHRAATLSARKAVVALQVILAAGGDPLHASIDPDVISNAICEGTPDAVDLLLRHVPHYDISCTLSLAAVNQRYGRDMVSYLLERGVGIDNLGAGKHSRTALWSALWTKGLSMVDLLLERGADCHKLQPNGKSVVDLAREMRLEALYSRMTGCQLDVHNNRMEAAL